MTEDEGKELPEFLSDPMSVLFDLNDEMLDGLNNMRYALGFSFWGGGLLALGSILYALWLVFYDQPEDYGWTALFLLIITIASAYACYSAHAERSFLEDYSILGRGIQRANEWKPDPKMPEGKDALVRLVEYLKETDDRIGAILERSPDALERDATVKGKSKETHKFDLFMSADKPMSLFSDDAAEGMILMVRKVDKATEADARELQKAAQDVLKREYPCDQGARIILLQTSDGKFDQAVADFANKNWMKYERDFENRSWDWSSPVELVAERPDRTYNLQNMYFG